jgi:hypothetical protein
MKQRLDNILAVSFTCPAGIAVGDVAIMDTAPKTVKKVDAAGSLKIVGVVSVHFGTDLFCTVDTKYRERRDNRVSGAAIAAPGPFVFDAAGKVILYNASTHDPAAIAGMVITTANGADVVVETLEY